MEIKEKTAVIEAILFACGEPMELSRISSASGIDCETVEKLITLLNDRYDEECSALRIVRLDDAFQMCTREKFAPQIRCALETKRNTPLSNAALEVLAIVAYNQPVTKGFVENVRGIDSSSVVNSLVEKDLLCEAGRLNVPGKPVAYKTTLNFLRCFNLKSLDELPDLPSKDGQVSFYDLQNSEAEKQTDSQSIE
ncbi:MAG: SMC-Scp complex subunit ScpB [Oscillospiraceae bacterium]|nr:SMC-Scp complex subunit ScpB [Oscillospiraceae bacterium]